jgi:hypothetical protein
MASRRITLDDGAYTPRLPESTTRSGTAVRSRFLASSFLVAQTSQVRVEAARAEDRNTPPRLPSTCAAVAPGCSRPRTSSHQCVESPRRAAFAGRSVPTTDGGTRTSANLPAGSCTLPGGPWTPANPLRQDADDRYGHLIEPNHLSNSVGPSAESGAPVQMTEHRCRLRVGRSSSGTSVRPSTA